MATRFIPTVERESIDLVYALSSSYVRTDRWIVELQGSQRGRLASSFSSYTHPEFSTQSGIRSFFTSEGFWHVLPTNWS